MSDNLLERLDREHRSLLRACGRLATERGERVFLVGGSVRDLLLEREHDDLDIVVEGDGMAVAQAVARSVTGELTRHHAFQTATVTSPGGVRIDVATARREEYPRPGQLPQVVPGSLREDLERRDFTINTLAISLGDDDWGAFVDPLDGLNDLRAGRIRVMHARSFADDPTRVLRALRFALRFGYEIEARTEEWLRQAVAGGYLADVSADRVRKEIRLSFGENPVEGPVRLEGEGVLQEIHAGLAADPDVLEALQQVLQRFGEGGERPPEDRFPPERRWALVLACCASALSPQGRWELARRLRLSREERAPLIDAGSPWRKARAAILPPTGAPRNSAVERALRPLASGALLVVAAASGGGSPEAELVWRHLEELRQTLPRLNGSDLLRLGVPEGPAVGIYLERLRAARLDAEVGNEDEERRLVRGWLDEKPL